MPWQPAVGIDLGTTNSSVGIYRKDNFEIIPNENGDHTTPSWVAFTENGRLIGASTEQAALNPTNTVFDVKRLIGRRFDDPQIINERGRLPFEIVDVHGRPAVQVVFNGEKTTFLPEEISAMILSKLKEMAQKYLDLDYRTNLDCVICIPSTFNSFQHQATINACYIAGLHVLRIVSEPSAAAFAYGLTSKHGKRANDERLCLFLDIGGGTVGATLLLLENGITEVLATAGSDYLGGEDFDHRLAVYLADVFEFAAADYKIKIKNDARAMSRLRAAAERAKRVLSSATATKVEVLSLAGDHDLSLTISRAQFEHCCHVLFESMTEILDQVLRPLPASLNNRLLPFFNKQTGTLDIKCIDDIVLAGGSSRIPKIQEIVSTYFNGKELNRSINASEAATFGASIQASILSEDISSQTLKGMLLLDVLPMSIWVNHGDSNETLLLAKNTSIPIFGGENFVIPISRGQSPTYNTHKFSFYEGEEKLLHKRVFLCELAISDLVRVRDTATDFQYFHINVAAHVRERHAIEFIVTDLRSKKSVTKLLDRSINPHSKDLLDRQKKKVYRMLRDDKVDAQRVILKSTLESEAYSLEDRANNLAWSSSIKHFQAEHIKSCTRKILRWLESSPRGSLEEYKARLEELDTLSKLVSSMVNMNKINESRAEVEVVAEPPSPSQKQVVHEPADTQADLKLVVAQNSPDNPEPVLGNGPTPAAPAAPQHHDPSFDTKLLAEPVSAIDSAPSAIQYPIIPANELNVAYPSLDDSSDQSDPSSMSSSVPGSTPPVFILPYRQNSSPQPSEDLSLEFANITFASIETRLGMYFTDQDGQLREKYTDKDLRTIALLLENTGRQAWSTVPRIYTVLRRIGQHQLLDDFIDLGITDIWLPISVSSLPDKLSPSIRSRFVDTQPMVLTAALEMEKERQHAHFGRDDPVPYQSVADLGSGGYGHVEKVISLLSHREFARKRFRRRKGFSKSNEVFKNFKNELAILKRLSHIHCVELVCSYTDPKYIALIMDPVADFNLAAYYVEAAKSREKIAQLRRFFGCLANALKYLHESKIRHRDIKPENILIKGTRVLLADFGLSFDWEHLSHSTTTADLPKTVIYASPEVANYERKKNSASDIWSLGCVFLEMVTVLKGETVSHMREFFKERTDNYLFHANMSGAKAWTHKLSNLGLEEDGIPVEWVANMLNRDPSRRPTAASLFSEILDCDTTVKFCGHCCESQDTDDSDSGDDHDPLADTMQEMTIKP